MGIYARRILPWLIDFGMRRKPLLRLREDLVAAARGQVLEIGVGSGLNLPFYPRDLEGLWGIDPSPELLAMARTQAAWVHFPVSLAEGRAEDLPLDDHSVDSVVMTWTLCSVAEAGAGARRDPPGAASGRLPAVHRARPGARGRPSAAGRTG